MFRYYEYNPMLGEDEYISLTTIECIESTIQFKSGNHIIASSSLEDRYTYLIFGNDFSELKGYFTRLADGTNTTVSFTLTTTDDTVLRNLYQKINAIAQSSARIESKVTS